MVKQVLVQLLTDDHDDYRWGIVNDKGQWEEQSHTGDKAALLSSLQTTQLPIVLVIPGEKVVTTRAVYSAAEKRHFRQLLPYQLEEQIIGDVEALHFAIGPMGTDDVVVAYVDDAWFAETIAWYKDHGFTISRCVADFQLLTPAVNQWIIWSTESRVLCAHSSGLGFAAHRSLLQPLLADIFTERHGQTAVFDDETDVDESTLSHSQSGPAIDIQLYGDSEQALDHLTKYLPDTIRGQTSRYTEKPALDLLGNHGIDFCQGPYARKLPLGHWWQASRTSAILAVAALLAFIAVNLLEVFQLKDSQHRVEQQIEQRYREVIPQGAMRDAVRQLQSKLGTTDADVSRSQAIYLIAAAAPAIEAQNIDITTLMYNNNDKALHLTIEAETFSAIEKLRKQLQTNGLQAELKRSDSSGDAVRARLHIGTAEG